jgi:hypothetical protein
VTGDTLRVEVAGVRGYPDTIAADLDRCDAAAAERCTLDIDGDDVTVTAGDAAAARWLYEWLEESVECYREEFIAATGEHAAARHLADLFEDGALRRRLDVRPRVGDRRRRCVRRDRLHGRRRIQLRCFGLKQSRSGVPAPRALLKRSVPRTGSVSTNW